MSAPKEKRRNSEKRKEKSRNAARCRREKETDLFYQLGHMLPLPHKVCSTLDKAGIMRLVLCHLKINKLLSAENERPEDPIKMEEDPDISEEENKLLELEALLQPHYTKALEGFLLVLSKEGDIVFLSDNVHKYLGLTQIDLLGQSIYEYSHPCDHEEIREQLSDRPGLNHISPKPEREHHSFLMRMKCTLTPKGKSVNLKSATYKVVHCTGHVKLSQSEAASYGQLRPPVPCMILVASPIPHPVNIETPLDTKTFMTRHSMDMKFTDCDERIKDLIGYAPEDLVGRSFYDFHHALDGTQIERCHRNLFAKGQTSTGHYRFLAKEGGYVWLETQATVIYHSKTNKAECVVCVNYVLSGLEQGDVPISLDQTMASWDCDGVKMSTEKIFAPKLGLAEEEEYPSWLMANKEQESEVDFLSMLAPNAGDTMIPLVYPTSISKTKEEPSKKPKEEQEKPLTALTTTKTDINRPLLTANQILFGQPGTVVDIPQKDLELPDKNGPLNSSHDPLLTTESSEDQAKVARKPSFSDLLSDEDLLSLYAPYIPMEEDLDLNVNMENCPQGFEASNSWTPVDPFANQNLEKEGFTPYMPKGSQPDNRPPFTPSTEFSNQPRSPPSILSSPGAGPSSPSSSFGGSIPNLCSFSGVPFSPINSPPVPELLEFPPSGQKMVVSSVNRGGGGPQIMEEQLSVPRTKGTTIVGGLTGLIGEKPPDYAVPTLTTLKRKAPPIVDRRSPHWEEAVHDRGLMITGPPPEKIRGIGLRNDPTFAANRSVLPLSRDRFSHSSLLQQVARNHTDPRNKTEYFERRSADGYGKASPRGKGPPIFSHGRVGNPSQSTLQMDELCRILDLTT